MRISGSTSLAVAKTSSLSSVEFGESPLAFRFTGYAAYSYKPSTRLPSRAPYCERPGSGQRALAHRRSRAPQLGAVLKPQILIDLPRSVRLVERVEVDAARLVIQ